MQLTNLSDYGLLVISGSDNFKLLQGQLTCDVMKINNTHCLLAAHCNPQGRILSLAHLFAYANNYYMLMQREMVSIALSALKKYALFYQVQLRDASDDWHFLGGGEQDKTLAISLAFDETRYIHLQPKQNANPFAKNISCNWQHCNIKNAIPTIYPQTSGKLLPHELNLHQLQCVISFDKGCYTGQEIIARMHYRGKSKKSMYQASIMSHEKPLPGDAIYVKVNSQLKECGLIIDICHELNNRYLGLIMIENSEAKNQHLFLKHNENYFFKFETLTHD